MRIGLFGGTFNPVHKAHIKIAEDTAEEFFLEKIFLIPSAIPPHKSESEIIDAKFRYNMLELAADNEYFIVSDVELKRLGPSYTIDTINHFIKKGFEDIFFLIGTDAFLELDLWRDHKEILKKTSLIVMKRPSFGEDTFHLKEYIENKIGPFKYLENDKCFTSKIYKPIYLSEVTQIDTSSTMIRDIIKKGGRIDHLVGKKVEDYINEKGLYR